MCPTLSNKYFTYLYFVFLTMKKFVYSKNCSRCDKFFYWQLGTVSRNGFVFLSFLFYCRDSCCAAYCILLMCRIEIWSRIASSSSSIPVLRMSHSEAFYRVCVKVLLGMHGHFRSEKNEKTFWNNYVHKVRRCRPLLLQHLQTYVTTDRVPRQLVRVRD